MKFTAATFVFATDTVCAAVGETPDACRADLENAPDDVQAFFADHAPRLALVDDATSPTAWRFVEAFYRVRDTAVGYEVGEGVNLFADEDAAIAAAESLDGEDFDCEVRAFTKPAGDSGRVVWGA